MLIHRPFKQNRKAAAVTFCNDQPRAAAAISALRSRAARKVARTSAFSAPFSSRTSRPFCVLPPGLATQNHVTVHWVEAFAIKGTTQKELESSGRSLTCGVPEIEVPTPTPTPTPSPTASPTGTPSSDGPAPSPTMTPKPHPQFLEAAAQSGASSKSSDKSAAARGATEQARAQSWWSWLWS